MTEGDAAPEMNVANRRSVTGLENVRSAARDLAARVRDTAVSVGEFAEGELAFAVGVAEDLRDRSIAPELLEGARSLPVLSGLRVTSHRVVDLGFDVVGVGVRVGSDAVDEFFAPRGKDVERLSQTA